MRRESVQINKFDCHTYSKLFLAILKHLFVPISEESAEHLYWDGLNFSNFGNQSNIFNPFEVINFLSSNSKKN